MTKTKKPKDTRPEHIFVCRFDSGAVATLRVRCPEPGRQEVYWIKWKGWLQPSDEADYAKWRGSILRDMEAASGRRHWFEEVTEKDLAARETEAA